MEFSTTTADAPRIRSGCLVAGRFEGGDATPAYQTLDEASGGKLDAVVRKARFRGAAGKHLRIHALDGVTADSVLVVGCGPKKEAMTATRYLKIAGDAARAAVDTGAPSTSWALCEIEVDGRDLAWKARIAVERLSDAAYRFDAMRGKADDKRTPPPARASIAASRRDRAATASGIETGRAVAAGTSLARDMGNLPGNVCTPSHLADQAKALAARHAKVSFKALDEARMKRLGMGSLLSVARGSRQPPRLIVLEYRGAARSVAPDRARGQGRHVRFGRDLDQARGRHGRNEVRHVRRGHPCMGATRGVPSRLGTAAQCGHAWPAAAENMPNGNATKPGRYRKDPWPARPWRFSTPTPKAVWYPVRCAVLR